MKLAYGVNGEGLGHAARLAALGPELSRWHRIEVFCPETVKPYLDRHFPHLPKHPVPAFTFSKQGDRVRLAHTLWKNLRNILVFPYTVFRLARHLRRHGFEGVLSDFEPTLAWAGRLAGLKVLQFNHPGMLLRNPRFDFQTLVGMVVAALMEGPWNSRIHVSFFRGHLGPIIRPGLRDVEVSDRGHILVYLKDGYRSAVLGALEKARLLDPGLHWRLFPDPRDNFDLALASCRAVITSAGHQTLSEALYLGKPILAIPQDQQAEQAMNARWLVRSGRGMSGRLRDVDQLIPAFLDGLPALQAASALPCPRGFRFLDDSKQAVMLITRALGSWTSPKASLKVLRPRPYDTWEGLSPVEVGSPTPQRVAIMGNGPQTRSLVWLLCRQGHQCVVFHGDAHAREEFDALRRQGSLRFASAREPNDRCFDLVLADQGIFMSDRSWRQHWSEASPGLSVVWTGPAPRKHLPKAMRDRLVTMALVPEFPDPVLHLASRTSDPEASRRVETLLTTLGAVRWGDEIRVDKLTRALDLAGRTLGAQGLRWWAVREDSGVLPLAAPRQGNEA